jgi:hypothetical protein
MGTVVSARIVRSYVEPRACRPAKPDATPRLGAELHVTGANRDLHSGLRDGAVLNPLEAAACLRASMRARDGRVAVEGWRECDPRVDHVAAGIRWLASRRTSTFCGLPRRKLAIWPGSANPPSTRLPHRLQLSLTPFHMRTKFLLSLLYLYPFGLLAQPAPPRRVIDADVSKVRGAMSRMYNFCVGAGRANEGLRADWQRQLRRAHSECGFRYIRFHGLFCDDMGAYQEDRQGHPIYNWQYIDELFDYLESIGMKPFVELGFMPSALASGPQTIFWYKANVTPPKDYAKCPPCDRALRSTGGAHLVF